ncbi:hypothetical protein CGRA01v4_09910 [Colletotrichum graminicola]|nr:hypothetical protein CGRA01v4_09910 [Colletotrichum graminicola]
MANLDVGRSHVRHTREVKIGEREREKERDEPSRIPGWPCLFGVIFDGGRAWQARQAMVLQ